MFFELIGLAACIGVFAYGLFRLVFSKGRRKQGLILIAVSMSVFVGIVLVGIEMDARNSGWESTSEKHAAAAAGFTEPTLWRAELVAQQLRIEAEAAKTVADAEAAKLAAETAKAEAEKKAADEERRKGFHCLSKWDGSHRDFAKAVQAMMRDPDSFEVVETRVTPVDDEGDHVIFMTYRARNGFGGMNVETAHGVMSNKTCEVKFIGIK